MNAQQLKAALDTQSGNPCWSELYQRTTRPRGTTVKVGKTYEDVRMDGYILAFPKALRCGKWMDYGYNCGRVTVIRFYNDGRICGMFKGKPYLISWFICAYVPQLCIDV